MKIFHKKGLSIFVPLKVACAQKWQVQSFIWIHVHMEFIICCTDDKKIAEFYRKKYSCTSAQIKFRTLIFVCKPRLGEQKWTTLWSGKFISSIFYIFYISKT